VVYQFWHLPVPGVLLKDLAPTAITAAKVDIRYALHPSHAQDDAGMIIDPSKPTHHV
jgi:hypothetical protein